VFRANQHSLVIQLSADERRMFADVLLQYPAVPEAHQRLSRSRLSPNDNEHQQLLDEALAAHRAELRGKVQGWLKAPGRFRRVKQGFNFTLLRTDTAWLLQVLNDVRVGSWLRLGAPEPIPDIDELFGQPRERLQHWVLMEVSGHFQMQLLQLIGAAPAP
jgi:hypothetical protein